jgi:hypothetical protein
MRRQGSTRPQHLLTLDRRLQAFRLRQVGLPYRAIAARMAADPRWQGRLPHRYDGRRTFRDVMTELTRQRVELGEAVHAVRQLELERLDLLQATIWGDAVGGDVAAVDAVLRIMAKRAVLLGLYAPLRIAPATLGRETSAPRAHADHYVSDDEAEGVARALAAYGQALRNQRTTPADTGSHRGERRDSDS